MVRKPKVIWLYCGFKLTMWYKTVNIVNIRESKLSHIITQLTLLTIKILLMSIISTHVHRHSCPRYSSAVDDCCPLIFIAAAVHVILPVVVLIKIFVTLFSKIMWFFIHPGPLMFVSAVVFSYSDLQCIWTLTTSGHPKVAVRG